MGANNIETASRLYRKWHFAGREPLARDPRTGTSSAVNRHLSIRLQLVYDAFAACLRCETGYLRLSYRLYQTLKHAILLTFPDLG